METDTRWTDTGHMPMARGKCAMGLQEAFRLRDFLFLWLVHPQHSWTAPPWAPASQQVDKPIEIIFLFDIYWVTGSTKS